jgi:type I restriction enzyme, R subunit
MNEAETRAEHIDPALREAGWGVVEGSRILREYKITPGRIEGVGRRGTPEIADYVLVYRNVQLAVNEAKAWGKALTEGVAQAKTYAGKMKIRFTFSTNSAFEALSPVSRLDKTRLSVFHGDLTSIKTTVQGQSQ